MNSGFAKPDIAIGFVLFHPGTQALERIKAAAAAGYQVFVFDNAPDSSTAARNREKSPNVHYSTAGSNVGLGYALAAITATAYYAGHKALLFFDQDTVFRPSTIAFIENFCRTSDFFSSTYAALVFDSSAASARGRDDPFVRDVLLAISSGSLFNLELLRAIGWHNPSYFVDCVDYELCLRAYERGFKIGRFPATPDFDHVSEQADQAYEVFGTNQRLRKYSVLRMADTAQASLRLLARSASRGHWRFTYAISRSLAIYILWQVVARVARPKRSSVGSR